VKPIACQHMDWMKKIDLTTSQSDRYTVLMRKNVVDTRRSFRE